MTKNTDAALVARRRDALAAHDIRGIDLYRRWNELYGVQSSSMVWEIISGRSRSFQLEVDFANVTGHEHEQLFSPAPYVRSGVMMWER